MKPSTAEDCLEALHALRASDEPRPMVEVARWLGTRLELATAMLEILRGEGLVECAAQARVRLTLRGRQETARVVRRRRLMEAVFVANHGCTLPAAQIIAARVAYAVQRGRSTRRRLHLANRTSRPEPSPPLRGRRPCVPIRHRHGARQASRADATARTLGRSPSVVAATCRRGRCSVRSPDGLTSY